MAIAPSIVDVTKPVIVIDTLEGDLKLNLTDGLIDITRIGNVVSEDKSPSCHANYVQDTKILTIPRVDIPVISPMNGTPTLLGTDTLSCMAKLSDQGNSLQLLGCSVIIPIDESQESADTEESNDDAQSEEPADDAQSEESADDAQSEESDDDAQSEEPADDAQSEESDDDAQSEESDDDAQSEEPADDAQSEESDDVEKLAKPNNVEESEKSDNSADNPSNINISINLNNGNSINVNNENASSSGSSNENSSENANSSGSNSENTNDNDNREINKNGDQGGSAIIVVKKPQFQSIPISGSAIDFGKVFVNTTSDSKTVAIMNAGNADLNISYIGITGTDSNSFTVSPTTSFVIDANSTDNHVLIITCNPSDTGDLSANLELMSNASQSIYKLSCTGKSEELIEEPVEELIEEPSFYSIPETGKIIDFDSLTVGNVSAPRTVTIMNQGTGELKVEHISIDGTNAKDFSISSVEPFTIPGNSSSKQELDITCSPSTTGVHLATLYLVTNDGNFNYDMSCDGLPIIIDDTDPEKAIFGSIPAVGNSISLSSVTVGTTSSSQTITISNGGDGDLNVKNIRIEGSSEFSVSPITDFTISANSSDTRMLQVNCTPTNEGNFSASLVLDAENVSKTYLLSCVGTEIVEEIAVFDSSPKSSANINFGNTAVGTTSSSQTITISNKGNSELVVDGFGIAGSNAFQVTSPTSLHIGASKQETIVLQCSPNKAGNVSATLNLNTNDANSSTVSYSLVCDGTEDKQPIFESNYVDSEIINLGKIVVNDSVTKDVNVMNAGNADLVVKQVTIKGEHANVFTVPTDPFTVSTDLLAKQTLTVTCKPSEKGEFTATLELMTNDPINERPSYKLSCEGQPKIVCSLINFDPVGRSDSVIASLGFGYDKGRDLHKPQSCLKGDNNQVGGETAKIDFTLINGYKQLKRDLNLSAELNVNAKVFKVNARTEFAMSHQDTSLSKSMFLKSEVFAHQQFNQQGLSEFGQKMLDNGEQCFISACGDSFLYQTDIGGRLVIAMKFDFTSEESKKSFFAELGASYKAVDIKAAVKKVKESVIKGSSITVRAEQIGGRASDLAKVFGTSSPIVSCSLNTIKESGEGDSCIEKAMKNAIAYARDEFAPNVGSKPHVLDFTTMKYSSAGVPIVLENVPMDIISARNKLASKYQKQYRDWMLAEAWLNGEFKDDFICRGNTTRSVRFGLIELMIATGTKEETLNKVANEPAIPKLDCIEYLTDIKNAIQTNLALIRNAGLWCFSDLTKCFDKHEEAYNSLKTYDQDWLYGIKVVEKTNTLEKSVSEKNNLSFYKKKEWNEKPKRAVGFDS
ncbi:MAG: choice-of-anchor D domain-containing protein [Candidatus Marithrix sp.]